MCIAANIDTYLRNGGHQYHRYHSWNHCYSLFQKLISKKVVLGKEKDIFAVHLAFFLASWGMYRGSSQLLQLDYTIFLPVVDALLDHDNIEINNLSYEGHIADHKVSKMLAISNAIRMVLEPHMAPSRPSDTLITKILLGTLCFVPALDRYFVPGFQVYRNDHEKWGNSALNARTIHLINQVFNASYQEFVPYRNGDFPDAKLIDMAFWQEGRNEAANKD